MWTVSILQRELEVSLASLLVNWLANVGYANVPCYAAAILHKLLFPCHEIFRPSVCHLAQVQREKNPTLSLGNLLFCRHVRSLADCQMANYKQIIGPHPPVYCRKRCPTKWKLVPTLSLSHEASVTPARTKRCIPSFMLY